MSINNDAPANASTSALTATSLPASLQARSIQNLVSSKRKRQDVDKSSEIDTSPFSISFDSSGTSTKRPLTLHPVRLLPRASLPLCALDTTASGSQFFSATIKALDGKFSDHVPTLLVARNSSDGRHYAIERVDGTRFAACRLVKDWTEASVQRQPGNDQDLERIKRKRLESASGEKQWWMSVAVERPDNASVRQQPSRLNLLKLAVEPDHIRQPVKIPAPRPSTDTVAAPTPANNLQPANEVASMLSPQDALKELCKQYLEALYLSRTSLAYFAKGPLSRVRAAFAPDGPVDDPTRSLSDSLRELLLTTSAMDRKYKESLSATIKESRPESLASPETKKQKKTKWKLKRDKAGFLSGETGAVDQWWREGDNTASIVQGPAETLEAALRRRTSKLRTRETFLQVIIILEVLAVEHAAAKVVEPDTVPESVDASPPKQKSKRRQDLAALLDTLLDRLTIWCSLDTTSPAKKTGDDGDGNDDTNDEPRSFCVEVVIPFYMSRIRHHASVVNKKLGGPRAPSPVTRRPVSGGQRPGEPSTRHVTEEKRRRTLSRVSTENLGHISRAPSLHRAATDSDLPMPRIKREGSEASSESLTRYPPAPQPRKRASLMQSMSFTRREVDLSAMSQATEAKLKKKAEVEQKLRDAITTLKKPNRSLATREIASSTDQSFAKATAKARPSASAQRQKHSVHVTATPRVGKAFDAHTTAIAVAQLPTERPGDTTRSHISASAAYPTAAPSPTTWTKTEPTAFAVPATGHRPTHHSVLPSASTFAASAFPQPTFASAVGDTPSSKHDGGRPRGFAGYLPPALARQPGTLFPDDDDDEEIMATHLLSPTAARSSHPQGSGDIGRRPIPAPPKFTPLTWASKAPQDAMQNTIRTDPGPQQASVLQTPSRPRKFFVPSSSAATHFAPLQPPAQVKRQQSDNERMAVESTPSKPTDISLAMHRDAHAIENDHRKSSVYASLGWDDDGDGFAG